MEFKEKRKFKTKAEEFHHGDWRKPPPKTFVTLETAIPELPKTELAKPDEAAFKKKLAEFEDKLKEINKSLEEK